MNEPLTHLWEREQTLWEMAQSAAIRQARPRGRRSRPAAPENPAVDLCTRKMRQPVGTANRLTLARDGRPVGTQGQAHSTARPPEKRQNLRLPDVGGPRMNTNRHE